MIIDQLPSLPSVQDTDEVAIERGTTTYKTTVEKLSDEIAQTGGVQTALAGKQDTLTFDNSPTNGSSNPVKSGGVYTALAGKQNTLTFDNSPTNGSSNPVKSGGVYTAVNNVASQLDELHVSSTSQENISSVVSLLSAVPTGGFSILRLAPALATDFLGSSTTYGITGIFHKASSNNAYFFAFNRNLAAIGNLSIANSTVSVMHPITVT